MNRPVRRALRRDPRLLVRLGLWSVLESAPALVIGLAIAGAIDDGFAADRPVTALVWLAVLGGAWLVAALGAQQVVLAVAAIVEPFREDLLGHVVEAALDRSAAPGPGTESSAVARSNLQVELARDALASVVAVVRSFAFTAVSVLIGLTALIPQVLALVLPPFVAGLGLFLLSLPALARRQRAFLLADERTAESVTAVAGGLRDITACAAQERVAAAVGRRVTEQAEAGRALARVTAVRTLSLAVGGWAPVVLVLAGTPWLLSEGAGPGAVLGALAYVTQSLAPALDTLVEGLGVSGVRLWVALDRIGEPARAAADRPRTAGDRRPAVHGGAELRGVTFAYGPHAEPVIAGLDLSVPEGDHLAVVGPSGIGKSTLAGLLAGVLRPDAGEVLVGGVPADRLDPAERVLIPQEAYVFRGSLMENLTYLARAGAREVDGAVAAIGLTGLVERLGGYSAEIRPSLLSPGERQLVALARAYLAPARLVVLDEATCHLDPVAEARAEEAFARRGGTLLVIAHRPASALRARRVLVMDGTRVRLGSHGELLSSSPLYADLVGRWDPRTASAPDASAARPDASRGHAA
ncbi:ABC transporter ATP-binding protein [Planomonospora sp. ID82291]|uniref:ATP-binding cassette domain-containing protein n=1 Tax=Planomonospora sp. ID82291 TaxID=2738136 RepID=UPI0018C3D78A|nr:ABC transporter ATP-binding protein [Planomonospora sp. ID82291]MBG0817240.1 ABC transporter ATP-binding protein [Planomonospora sp. ID82291]